jgi:hypothetical protein
MAGTGKVNRPPRLDPLQLSLDDYYVIPQPPPPTSGSLNFDHELRATLSTALKECPHSRAEIAARMSELTGDDITIHMLNAWTAESREFHRFPFGYAAAFEVATGSQVLQLLLARKRGSLVLMGQEALDAELGLVRRRLKELQVKERELLRGNRWPR